MATTASDIQAQAAVNAWLKSQTIKDMQQSIEDAYTAGVGQATASNEQILNQLKANLEAYNKQYEADARSAYLSKMQGDRLVDTELSRLGLSDSGYGVSQRLANQGVYSQNLYSLKNALNKNVADVNLARANQEVAHQAELQKLLQDKANAKYDLNKYISDMSEEIRQNAVSNYLQQQYNNTIKQSNEQKLDDDNITPNQRDYNLFTTGNLQRTARDLNRIYENVYSQNSEAKGIKGAHNLAVQLQRDALEIYLNKGLISKDEFRRLVEVYEL